MRRLARFKPSASIKAHLLAAALMWSFIGIYLMARGVLLSRDVFGWLAVVALAVGTGKALLVLDRTAGKNIARILAMQEGACLGGVYSWRMWGMVVCMMIGGRLLRNSSVPALWIASLYIAVGWALLLSSRLLWRQWRMRLSSSGKAG